MKKLKDFHFPRGGHGGEPLLDAIQRLETEGFEVQGLRDEYMKMKSALRAQAQVFQSILELAVAKSATFGVIFDEEESSEIKKK